MWETNPHKERRCFSQLVVVDLLLQRCKLVVRIIHKDSLTCRYEVTIRQLDITIFLIQLVSQTKNSSKYLLRLVRQLYETDSLLFYGVGNKKWTILCKIKTRINGELGLHQIEFKARTQNRKKNVTFNFSFRCLIYYRTKIYICIKNSIFLMVEVL